MTTIGAASGSSPVFQAQPPAPPSKKTGKDNDGDENAESAATKVSEAATKSLHKVDVQA